MTARPALLTPEEAGEFLKKSTRVLAKARSTGHPAIPFAKIGKSIRYSQADLDAYIAENTHNKVGGVSK